jgi:methionyl-tRNA formyltransferase
MKVVYCGYDFFWNVLQEILDGKHQLLALYTFRTDDHYDFHQKVTALAHAVETPLHLDPITLHSLDPIPRADRHLLICAAYPHKVPIEVIASFEYVVNVHPSLLPAGRGPWPLPWSILRGDVKTGVTLHKLDRDWDAGDILLQEEIAVSAAENLESLSAKLQLRAAPLVAKFLANPRDIWRNAWPQSEGSYQSWPQESDRTIVWDAEVASIDRVIRAFGKFESFAWIQGRKYFVRDASVWQQQHAYAPGTLVHVMNRELVVAARDGLVCVRHFELAPPASAE